MTSSPTLLDDRSRASPAVKSTGVEIASLEEDADLVGGQRSGAKRATLKQSPPGCESMGYDLHESSQFMAYVNGVAKNKGRVKGFWRWNYLCLTGVGTGIIAIAIQMALVAAFDLQYELQDALTEYGLGLRYVAWAGIRTCLAAVAGVLVCYVQPLAGGSGIPEIKCHLNGVDLPGVLELRTLAAKAVGIVFSVASGLPCGKEGPMIHSGAIMGSLMTHLNAGSLKSPFRQHQEARDMTAAGAAAGVAAAFGAPIGGVLFAVEEGASHMNPRILVRTFVCASLATLTVRFFLGPLEGDLGWGKLGTEVPVEFGRFPSGRVYMVWELLIFAMIGVSGGLCGAAFNQLNYHLTMWRMAHIGPRGTRRFLEVLFVVLVISSVNFWAPLILGGETERANFTSAQLLFQEGGNNGIKALFHNDADFDWRMLLIFSVIHFAEACWTYGLGVPSGLFVPSLLAGASLGRLVGQLMQASAAIEATPGVYALIGATAFLSGMARITISLAVILMETTGDAEFGLPIFITVMAAKWTGDKFNKGLYDIHIGLKKVPLLEHFPEKDTLTIQARHVMETCVKVVSPQMTVRELLQVLGGCHHHGFPVVEMSSSRFLGLVQRNSLHHLLQLGKAHGAFVEPGEESSDRCHVPFEAMASTGYPDCQSFETVRESLEPEDLDKVVDLTHYMNSGCYTVPANAVMARCFMLFRTMGLRHLPVVGEDRKLQGMITRKDLILEEEEDALIA
eukprot:CAMPEP_0197639596 /NCGR_PEP_ID=MMETSP1338-20131121/14172_1 /TAXON_ID=43686 ORGANISM="Pelagodinium beii, Strain RCC1491" /NCGR_SAMPLE_ID=MMETSP1338 /ASSEMBLY_ACC=CAM_ASM_000754 /LENGTH=732 /DNA_ID=CAMNT_0043212343 /DNA_START=107 /DNA_END=2305 /DNA_ORIENTATION=-